MDLGRGLPQQEEATTDEDHVAPRELVPGNGEERFGQADDPGDRQQQQDPHPHRQTQADVPRLIALGRRQALHEDRDEDDVVDAEHDLEHGQRQQGDPGLGGGEQRDEVHAFEDTGHSRAPGVPWRAVTDTRPIDARRCPSSTSCRRACRSTAAPRVPRARRRAARRVPSRIARRCRAFHVWTLGCQMNRSDSEEMAGRLLAAGCAEASSMETADLVVINTCAIREGAEQKVIGRQGHLARLKAANPGLRVVLTGCSVREPDRGGLRRRYPAVDLFLRPDEEPELVDRLGLASAQGAIGSRARPARSVPRPRSGGRSSASPTGCRRPGPGPSGRGPSPAVRRSAPGCRSSTAATRPAPTASCRSAAGRSAAARSTTSSTRRARWPRPATARSRCSART